MSPVPRPVLVRSGRIAISDGQLRLDDWEWASAGPAGAILPDLNTLAGRSVKELHGIAHGTGCTCPVAGFEVTVSHCGQALVRFPYDCRPPFTGFAVR